MALGGLQKVAGVAPVIYLKVLPPVFPPWWVETFNEKVWGR